MDVYFVSDIRRSLVGALTLAIETAAAGGAVNTDHLAGILTMAKHQAAVFGIPWSFVANDARMALGNDAINLLGGVSGKIENAILDA